MDSLVRIFAVLVIVFVVSQPILAWMKYDNEHGTPRVHFYSPEAYADCGSMMDEARRHGASHWTCHRP